jgi:hypothetical protein
MRWRTPRSLLSCLLTLAVLALTGSAAEDKKDAKEEGFKSLFNGTDLSGWKTQFTKSKLDPKKTVTVKDGVIVVTGHPNGFFYTDKSHKDYVLRFDWRYKRPKKLEDDAKFTGNSGCLVHIQNPEKGFNPKTVWPECVEVQGMNRDHGKLLFLKPKGTIGATMGMWDKKARDKAVRKVGEWNTTEVTCKADGSISVKVNGTPVSSGKGYLKAGAIGFQSEGSEIHFRNIRIKEMK